MLVLKTAAGDISDFQMLMLASDTSIYARTYEINCHYLMTLSFFAVRNLNVRSKTSVIFQLPGPNNRKYRGKPFRKGLNNLGQLIGRLD